jgi:hypothetical protein
MIHTKSVIFVVISIFVVTLIYSSFTPFIVFAVPPDSNFDPAVNNCTKKVYTNLIQQTCCWQEKAPGSSNKVTYCQTCYTPTGPGIVTCDPKQKQAAMPGNLQDLPTLEQSPTTPPRFGKIPGGAEEPLTQAPTQPTPNGSETTEGGSTIQQRSPQTVTPEITKDDNEQGKLPTIERNESSLNR